jgi:hemoglobin
MNKAFELLGGEAGIRALVDRFYALMDSLPEAATIRAMHPADLTASRDKLLWFLVGRFGGPPMYEQRFGHPRLRMRHAPFAVDSAAAEAWMRCMDGALAEQVPDEAIRAELSSFFRQVAMFMRNSGP